MNIYADRGNLLLLERRCQWRGIVFELSSSGLGESLDPDVADLFYIGGGKDGYEGVRQGVLIGTYLHGPLLPKNVWLADWLIEAALGESDLPSLDDRLENAAHADARRAAGL